MSINQISTRQYSITSPQIKKKLINRVIQQGYSINSSALLYGIKLSTAKAIVLKYKKTGKIQNGRNQRSIKQKQFNNQNNMEVQSRQKETNYSNCNFVQFNAQWYDLTFFQYQYASQLFNLYKCFYDRKMMLPY